MNHDGNNRAAIRRQKDGIGSVERWPTSARLSGARTIESCVEAVTGAAGRLNILASARLPTVRAICSTQSGGYVGFHQPLGICVPISRLLRSTPL
jgi:hypothetical protein